MHIEIRRLEDAVVLDLNGRFEFKACAHFKQAVDELECQGCRHLILNFKDVSYLDSAGLGLLHYAHQRLAVLGGRVSVVNPQPSAQKMLALANLPSIIPIHSLEEEAILVG